MNVPQHVQCMYVHAISPAPQSKCAAKSLRTALAHSCFLSESSDYGFQTMEGQFALRLPFRSVGNPQRFVRPNLSSGAIIFMSADCVRGLAQAPLPIRQPRRGIGLQLCMTVGRIVRSAPGGTRTPNSLIRSHKRRSSVTSGKGTSSAGEFPLLSLSYSATSRVVCCHTVPPRESESLSQLRDAWSRVASSGSKPSRPGIEKG